MAAVLLSSCSSSSTSWLVLSLWLVSSSSSLPQPAMEQTQHLQQQGDTGRRFAPIHLNGYKLTRKSQKTKVDCKSQVLKPMCLSARLRQLETKMKGHVLRRRVTALESDLTARLRRTSQRLANTTSLIHETESRLSNVSLALQTAVDSITDLKDNITLSAQIQASQPSQENFRIQGSEEGHQFQGAQVFQGGQQSEGAQEEVVLSKMLGILLREVQQQARINNSSRDIWPGGAG